ncbi:uncharacterized protein LOC135482813 [Lineus longissimus]|uniref:uncharacterized protein LOC135482813 n=1 Tax=Lineus longissimus TaxID=88925 RepID=UPI00315D2846
MFNRPNIALEKLNLHIDQFTVIVGKMAASLLAMMKELECPICFKLMNNPRIVGSCKHVFCEECLRKHISTKGTSETFPCPNCRVDNAVSADGVEGLKVDFRTASSVEILLKAESPRRTCSVCGGEGDTQNTCSRKMAEYLCDTCDLDLCSGCRNDHSEVPGTVDHIFYDLCKTHWRRMKHFCRSCSMVICGLCKKSEHADKTHETVLYKCSFEEDISNVVDEAGETLARALLKHGAAGEGERVMKEEVESRRCAVADSAKAIVESSNAEITDLRTRIKEMQAEVLKLEKRVDRVIARKEQFDKVEKETADDYYKSVATFNEVLSDLIAELRRQSEQLQHLKSTNCLGSSHNASVIVCKGEIRKITSNIRETLRTKPKQRKLAPMPVLNVEFPEFTAAKYYKDWSFKENGIKRIFSIEILPNEFGVAILGGTSSERWSQASKIFFSPSLQSKDINVITDGVMPGLDLTGVASTGDLILLRKTQPHIKFYRYGDQYLRADDLHVSSDLGNPKSITFDEKRNLLFIIRVKPRGPKSEVLQIDGSNGSILKTVDCNVSGRLACDPIQEWVFKCFPGVESYNETTLNYSNSWHVPNVEICDVNLSTDERLYAAGRRPSYEIVLYHIGPEERVKQIGPLLDGKGQQVVCDQPCNPRSAVCGDLLLVGVGFRVLFYRLEA